MIFTRVRVGELSTLANEGKTHVSSSLVLFQPLSLRKAGGGWDSYDFWEQGGRTVSPHPHTHSTSKKDSRTFSTVHYLHGCLPSSWSALIHAQDYLVSLMQTFILSTTVPECWCTLIHVLSVFVHPCTRWKLLVPTHEPLSSHYPHAQESAHFTLRLEVGISLFLCVVHVCILFGDLVTQGQAVVFPMLWARFPFHPWTVYSSCLISYVQ